jgi:hypothetical protein
MLSAFDNAHDRAALALALGDHAAARMTGDRLTGV